MAGPGSSGVWIESRGGHGPKAEAADTDGVPVGTDLCEHRDRLDPDKTVMQVIVCLPRRLAAGYENSRHLCDHFSGTRNALIARARLEAVPAHDLLTLDGEWLEDPDASLVNEYLEQIDPETLIIQVGYHS